MTRSRDIADQQKNLGGAVAPFVAGKNKIINGDFSVWQRGTSFSNLSNDAYVADRWCVNGDGSGATKTWSQQAFTAGTAPVAGYEGTYFLRFNQSVAGSGATYNNPFRQKIEDVRTFAGQTVTISYWAKADAARSLQTVFVQAFGSGGSSPVYTGANPVTLTTSWTRYTATLTLPSIAGKTIGAGNNLELAFTAANNTVQTIDLWGVQVEAGNQATSFTLAGGGSQQAELALCQRYYWRAYNLYGGANNAGPLLGAVVTSTIAAVQVFHPVPMRVAPTSLDYANTGFYVYRTGGNYQSGTWSAAVTGLLSTTLYYTTTGLTVNDIGIINQIGSGANISYIGLSAEL